MTGTRSLIYARSSNKHWPKARIKLRKKYMFMLTKNQQELLEEITVQNENPTCLSAMGQPLVDDLCSVIRELFNRIERAS